MNYTEYIPSQALRPYVKCYYIFDSGTDAVYEDRAFATGCIEMMFNLGTGSWEASSDGIFKPTPAIELWGQVIEPLSFRSLGRNTMLGIRFYPHTAAIFLDAEVGLFNNSVSSLADVGGKPVVALHSMLRDTPSINEQINLVESFLTARLLKAVKRTGKTNMIGQVINELKQEDFFDNIVNVAGRYGMTSRYLQKLFIQHTGIGPKLYQKINRFQNSLLLVAKGNASLTSIAYECGYFDQSHFIRDFKFFTGITPSASNAAGSSAILASPNK